MIIVGSRPRTRTDGVLTAQCGGCGNTTAHRLFTRTSRLTVFFVPTIPLGTGHFTACSLCGRTLRITAAEHARLQGFVGR